MTRNKSRLFSRKLFFRASTGVLGCPCTTQIKAPDQLDRSISYNQILFRKISHSVKVICSFVFNFLQPYWHVSVTVTNLRFLKQDYTILVLGVARWSETLHFFMHVLYYCETPDQITPDLFKFGPTKFRTFEVPKLWWLNYGGTGIRCSIFRPR